MAVKDNTYGIAPVQDKMLEILKHFISLCEANGLRYCACGGTCIGALRHHGFIPWDDDLDVYMPRPDYERLWENYDKWENNAKYKLCRTTPEKNYHHRVMQMVDLETTFINRRSVNEDIEHGVYIDIIPLDVRPKSGLKRMTQIFDAMVFSVYNIQSVPEYHGNKLQNAVTHILLSLVKDQEKRTRLWQKYERKMLRKQEWDESLDIAELTTNLRALFFNTFPHEWFKFDGRKAQFEDIEINIPAKAEEYLTMGFGDYMQLPPVEKRKPQRHTVYVDLNNPYKIYKGIYYCCEQQEEQG